MASNRRWRLQFRYRGSRRESAVAQLFSLGGSGASSDVFRQMSMKHLAPVLLLAAMTALAVMLSTDATAGDTTRPGFTNLTQAVEFLAQCVHRDDFVRFTNACARPINSTQMHSNVFVGLKRADARKPLQELYSGKEFPTNTSSFMMGGHAKELGFINIPFVRTNGMWYVADYFYCR